MKKNNVVKKSETFEELAQSLFFDKDDYFKVNHFACFVALLVSGFCLLSWKLSKNKNDE